MLDWASHHQNELLWSANPLELLWITYIIVGLAWFVILAWMVVSQVVMKSCVFESVQKRYPVSNFYVSPSDFGHVRHTVTHSLQLRIVSTRQTSMWQRAKTEDCTEEWMTSTLLRTVGDLVTWQSEQRSQSAWFNAAWKVQACASPIISPRARGLWQHARNQEPQEPNSLLNAQQSTRKVLPESNRQAKPLGEAILQARGVQVYLIG